MDSPAKPDNDDGIIRINRMDPGHVDIVLGSHPSRPVRPPREARSWGLIFLCAVLAILSVCLLLSQVRRHAPAIAPAKPAVSAPTTVPLPVTPQQ